MALPSTRQAELTTVASFPSGYFLENLVMRRNKSLLVTVLNKGELWYAPPVDGKLPVEPSLLFTFDRNALGIVEVEDDLFFIASGHVYTTHDCYLHRLDLRGWAPGEPIDMQTVLTCTSQARGLNGMCQLAPRVLLIADCFASLIWRIDLDSTGLKPKARVWLEHESMGYYPGAVKPEQPGVNGVRFAAKTNHIYYTSTAKKLLMRVAVDPETLDPAGHPELVVAGRMGDDFCIDEDAEALYLATHRQNTIDRVSMHPADNSGFTESVVGDPFTDQLIGPSGGIWGRDDGDYGRRAYFITDGGTASPPQGMVAQPAKLLRVDLS